ncbi:MAG: transcriptional repressor [Akkermansia sp.]|nr:transcriptional repressor [Akkermansia sp.]
MVTANKKPTGHNVADDLMKSVSLRQTRQRRAVLETILNSCDHPCASIIYKRASKRLPGISLATVYNCLETLAEKRLINQLNFDNGPSRFCPNLIPHVHVLDDSNNRVLDVKLKEGLRPEDVFDIPEGVTIVRMDACLHGMIPEHALS